MNVFILFQFSYFFPLSFKTPCLKSLRLKDNAFIYIKFENKLHISNTQQWDRDRKKILNPTRKNRPIRRNYWPRVRLKLRGQTLNTKLHIWYCVHIPLRVGPPRPRIALPLSFLVATYVFGLWGCMLMLVVFLGECGMLLVVLPFWFLYCDFTDCCPVRCSLSRLWCYDSLLLEPSVWRFSLVEALRAS